MAEGLPLRPGTAAVDSNRKRSRSPSDTDQKQHKRANTGAPPSSNESSRADDSVSSAAAAINERDSAMNDADYKVLNPDDTAASTPTAADGKADSPSQPSGKGSQQVDSSIGNAQQSNTGSAMIHMRCLIVTQDASIIIGRGGKHVNEIREKSGARVMVSESIPGNPERILNVSGPLDAVSKVCWPLLLFITIERTKFTSPNLSPGIWSYCPEDQR